MKLARYKYEILDYIQGNTPLLGIMERRKLWPFLMFTEMEVICY